MAKREYYDIGHSNKFMRIKSKVNGIKRKIDLTGRKRQPTDETAHDDGLRDRGIKK